MRSLKTVRSKPLDDLVLKVYHIESLRESKCLGDFLEGIRFMVHNLDESLEALGGFMPVDAAERRMAEKVKLSAMRLLQLCRASPKYLTIPINGGRRPCTSQPTTSSSALTPDTSTSLRYRIRGSGCCGRLCEDAMKKNNRRTHDTPVRRGGHVRLGKILIELRNAIRRIERCRLTLLSLGFTGWQDIVKDVDPALRFLVRPQLVDAIILRLEGAGEPLSRDLLVSELCDLGEGPPDRIRSAITVNLRAKKLVLHPDDKIGVPPRKKKKPA